MIGSAQVTPCEQWTELTIPLSVKDGVHPLYLRYAGEGMLDLLEITFA